LLTIVLLLAAPFTEAQTPETQRAASAARPTTSAQPTSAAPGKQAAHRAGRVPSRHSPAHAAAAKAHGSAPAGKAEGGVVALGATDITGNKELPKVMVIVPWKRSPGAGEVIAPTDSLLDEVLGPVDRGVFQRRIRYYGQLNAAGGQPAAARVAPVGDRQ